MVGRDGRYAARFVQGNLDARRRPAHVFCGANSILAAIEMVPIMRAHTHFTLRELNKIQCVQPLRAGAGGSLCTKMLRSDYKKDASAKRPFCARQLSSNEKAR